MITLGLFDQAFATLFTSTSLAATLEAIVLGEIRLSAEDLDRLTQACRRDLVGDLDRELPGRFRQTDILATFRTLWRADTLVTPDLPWMDTFFAERFVMASHGVHHRDLAARSVVGFAMRLDVTLLVGWHYAGLLGEGAAPHDILRFIGNQQPYFSLPPRDGHAFAENHVHWGGIGQDSLLLLARIETEEYANLPQADREMLRRLRRVIGGLLFFPEATPPVYPLQEALDDAMIANVRWDRWDWTSLANRCVLDGTANDDFLRFHLARRMAEGGPRAEAWVWFVTWLWHRYRQPGAAPELRATIWWVFLQWMRLRRAMIMDGVGLTRFVRRYYSAPLRDLRSSPFDDARQLLGGPGDVAEVKVAPSAVMGHRLAGYANALAAARGQETLDVERYFGDPTPPAVYTPAQERVLDSLEAWHICVHFIRGENLTSLMNVKEARKLEVRLNNQANWRRHGLLGGGTRHVFDIHPPRWIRGFDVAGDENVARIELFAPALRWLRRGARPVPDGSVPLPDFHLSVHAGEDFAHPLSGLRHVDETMRFCGLRRDDRIGHGLALGLDLAGWMDRQGDILLDLDEHFDNLVWAWHQAVMLAARVPLAERILRRLERRILALRAMVTWLQVPTAFTWPDEEPVSPPGGWPDFDTLYRAWELRRNCPTTFAEGLRDGLRPADHRVLAPDLARARPGDLMVDSSPTAIFFRRATRKRSFDEPQIRVQRRSGGTIVLPTAVNERCWVDFESDDDVAFLQVVQDHLLDQVDQCGVLIEACPTSNVSIGRMNDYTEHPIFRWTPLNEAALAPGGHYNLYGLRRGPIRVLVNTDDPGIMPTTIRTEFALLREAALTLGHSRSTTDAWLDRIREEGLLQFRANHARVAMRME